MRSITIAPLPYQFFREEAVIWLSHDNSNLQNARKQAEINRLKTEHLNNELQDLITQHQLILDNMPAYVVSKDVDDDFRYVSCNAYFTDLLNCSEEDVIGKTNFELFSKDKAENLRAMDEKAVANPDLSNEQLYTATFTGINGRKRYGVFYRKMVVTLSGQRLLFVLMSDVTELEEERLYAQELASRFELTLNSIGDGVIATDSQGDIMFINPVAERMIGCHKKDVIGKPHETYFKTVSYPDNWPTSSPVRRSLRTGEIVELANHTDLLCLDRTLYHIADSSSPIRNKEGKIIGAILVFRDVTEDYNKRDQLRLAIESLEEGANMTKSGVFKMNILSQKILNWPKHTSSLLPLT